MKTPAPLPFRTHRFRPNPRSTRSAALLIVLGCLALISVLIVAFFASATTERQSAQIYANASSVKLLSDSTVSIVMGKIKDATKGTDTAGNVLSWASQPGMIRNYNTTSANAVAFYKLYSWNGMVTNSFSPTDSNEIPPTTWTNSPSIYTDLNEPITASGIKIYPIVDPAAATTVKGFSITGAPISTLNAAPMPVKWLYALSKGQVISPDTTSTGNTATFAQTDTANRPSKDNPIVGRIAFWTDDDTCKVNINTAAGDVWIDTANVPAMGSAGNPGAFWDTPRVWTTYDYTSLALYQPANGEYQRYPGHPATTDLSAVFPSLTSDQIYQIVPRVSKGGSLGGTAFTSSSILSTVDNDRLYSSVDELLVSTNRVVNLPFTKSSLEAAKFFLTATSRAPEVNLYNEPRVTIWPINSVNSTSTRSAFDKLIAYCGTLNGNPYYFQRKDPTSATVDYPTDATPTVSAKDTELRRNRQLVEYLKNLTAQPVPGFSQNAGDTISAKYGQDNEQILTEIFDYVRCVNVQDNNVTAPYGISTYGSGEGQVVPISNPPASGDPYRGFGVMPVIKEVGLLFIGRAQVDSTGTSKSFYTAQDTAATLTTPSSTRVQAALFVNLYNVAPGYGNYGPNFQITITHLDNLKWTSDISSSTEKPMGFVSPGTVKIILQGFAGYLSFPIGDIGIANFALAKDSVSPFKPCKFVSDYLDCTTGGKFHFSGGTFTIEVKDITATPKVLQTYTITLPGNDFPVPDLAPYVTDSGANAAVSDFRSLTNRFDPNSVGMLQTYFCSKDVVRSVVLNTDPRLIAASTIVGADKFSPVYGYDYYNPPGPTRMAHGVVIPVNGGHKALTGAILGRFSGAALYSSPGTSPYVATGVPSDFVYGANSSADPLLPQAIGADNAPRSGAWKANSVWNPPAYSTIATVTNSFSTNYMVGATGVYANNDSSVPGDWDNGNGGEEDGAFINKVDEGSIPYNVSGLQTPYFGAGYKTVSSTGSIITTQGATFSPNRQLPSAGMFGSLSTGVRASRPWQTLLFRPDPTLTGSKLHKGSQSPQDHLYLDFFNMPVVEPYAISDPFSTAGKVNMNYQIIPFSSYMTRSTAIQAVMRAEQVLAVPNDQGTAYKGNTTKNFRYYLDLDKTLLGFSARFDTGDIFRSASEICNIWMIPANVPSAYVPSGGITQTSAKTFWGNPTYTGLTGDNSRERPYTDFYPRLTTKSNSYTVHMKVQTLKKMKNADDTTWVEGSDIITGEYRGSSTLERYLDTSDGNIPDYALETQPLAPGKAIDNFYKFRVIETKQFTP